MLQGAGALRFAIGAALAIGALVATVGIGLSAGLGSGGDGTPSELDVPQTGVAESSGIRISAVNAAFSGTATFVELRAEIVDPQLKDALRLSVPAGSLAPQSLGLAPGSRGFSLAANTNSLIRLGPASPGQAATISFNEVRVSLGSGDEQTVTGNWSLELSTPGDLVQRLRTEQLTGTASQSNGVTVEIMGAMRSYSETLVSVRVTSAQELQPLGEPFLLVDGERVYGALLAEQEESSLLTYSFPPTAFGSTVGASFGPFVSSLGGQSGELRLDVGAILARHPAEPADGASLPVAAADVLSGRGALKAVRSVKFSDGYVSSSHPGPNKAIVFVLEGDFGHRPKEFQVIGPDGHEAEIIATANGYSKDPAGTISSPRTEVAVLYDSIESLRGTFTITWAGAESQLVRGDWTSELTPAP